jgi:hypothetical protein
MLHTKSKWRKLRRKKQKNAQKSKNKGFAEKNGNWSAIQPCQFFSSQNPLRQPRSVCEVEVAPQQLRDELKLGPLKELREGEEVRRALSQLESLQQDREV